MKQQENNKLPLGGVTIKIEPGTSTSPVMQRLPSLRPPRDLSLSAYSQKIPNLNQAKNKKIYIPNLNVQRNKLSKMGSIKAESLTPNLPERNERGRVRGKRNVIQLNQGIFSEGFQGQKNSGRGRSSGGSADNTDNVLKKPIMMSKVTLKIDKHEEELTMKQLLKDDFVEDPNLEPDFENCPITLPLIKSKDEPGLKKKSDLKTIDKKEFLSINEIFCDITTTDPGFIFFQLPNSMPGLNTQAQTDESKHNFQLTSHPAESTESKHDGERCLLSSLPAGRVGKLQILKSGRARLVFGDTKMWLEMGTQVAFRQDLVSIDLEKETHSGHMSNLGPLSARMFATPDWEAMMSALKTEKRSC